MAKRPMVLRAIEQRTLVQIDYDRSMVRVEPHIYGVDRQGNELLAGWVVAGSRGRWTIERLDDAKIVQPITEHFEGPRSDYVKDDPMFATIYAAL